MSRETSRKISKLGFLMSLIVVLYHISYFKPISVENVTSDIYIYFQVSKIYEVLGTWTMHYFITMTSFLLYYGITKENAKKKLINRVHSLIIPYCIWNVLYYIFYLIIYKKEYLLSLKDFLFRFLFLPFDAPLWYISTIIILLLLVPIVVSVRDKKRLTCSVGIVLIIGTFILKCVLVTPPKGHELERYFVRMLGYMPNYLIGMLLALYTPKIVEYSSTWAKWTARILLITSLIVCFRVQIPWVLRCFISVCAPFLLWVSTSKKAGEKRKTDDIYKASFFIYASHACLIYVVEHILEKWFYFEIRNGIAAVLLRLAGGVVIVCILIITRNLLRKISPKVLSVLTGNRA